MTESGVHVIPVTVGVAVEIVTVFPDVVDVSIEPFAMIETPLVKPIVEEVSVVVLEIVSATVATTPLGIEFVLLPDTTQVETPAVALLQAIDFEAEVAAAPADTVIALKSFVEYVRVH